MTFALFFGNRGFFPGEVVASARAEMAKVLKEKGYDYIMMDESLTRYGAVETIAEGRKYAEFLRENEGKYDGVILSLPNFGDENGMMAALENVKVPILVQAFRDEIGYLDHAHRRDAFCGKLAMCNVLRQRGIPFSLTKNFTVNPLDSEFKQDLDRFAAVCRVVNRMRLFRVGVFGARTTPFKTTRYDEVAFERKGITVEVFDLSLIFDMMDAVDPGVLLKTVEELKNYADFSGYALAKIENQARFVVAIRSMIAEYGLSAVAIRCWNEIEMRYGIAPCVGMSLLGNCGVPAACETDATNAVMMYAMSLASDEPVMLLDVNNNYEKDPEKCVLFHCGVAPRNLMREEARVGDHLSFEKSYGKGCGVGVALGALFTGEATLGSIKTENGEVSSCLAEGIITEDCFNEAFFGIYAVFKKHNLPEMLNYMAKNGYKHHMVVARGHVAEVVREAFTVYLGYDNDLL